MHFFEKNLLTTLFSSGKVSGVMRNILAIIGLAVVVSPILFILWFVSL